MQSMTIREAKARLNALVEAAERGEQVVLMRGSKHVARIVPLSEEDLEVSPRLTDAQAERLWARLAAERRNGRSLVVEGPQEAVALLSRRPVSSATRSSPLRRAGRSIRRRPR